MHKEQSSLDTSFDSLDTERFVVEVCAAQAEVKVDEMNQGNKLWLQLFVHVVVMNGSALQK